VSVIGPVTQDAAIAPRTGSGSPQSQAQQRADAAPAVVADNAEARVDPGVMLKVVPPVQERSNSIAIGPKERQDSDALIGRILADATLDENALSELVASGRRADDAILERMAAWLESLPENMQSAIRAAKTPEIARLLKIAVLIEPGLKTAPSVVLSDNEPLSSKVIDATQKLLNLLRGAPAFRLAALLNQLTNEQPNTVFRGLQSRQAMNAAVPSVLHGSGPFAGFADGTHENSSNASEMVAATRAIASEEVKQVPSKLEMVRLVLEQTVESTQATTELTRSQPNEPIGDPKSGSLNGSSSEPKSGAVVMTAQSQNGGGLELISSGESIERAIADALKLVMDGRLIWAGRLTSDVTARVERSDAWQANRRSLGGMEKGTAIRVDLDLPTLGLIEIRALLFSSRVSASVVTEPRSAATFVDAMPKLQDALRGKGLSPTSVVIETR